MSVHLWSHSLGGFTFPGLWPQGAGTATTATITGTGATGTVTLNSVIGTLTSSTSVTTAAGSTFTVTLTDSLIAAGDILLAVAGNGTNTGGTPMVANVTITANTAVIVVQNIHASAAFNGSITIAFFLLKQAQLT